MGLGGGGSRLRSESTEGSVFFFGGRDAWFRRSAGTAATESLFRGPGRMPAELVGVGAAVASRTRLAFGSSGEGTLSKRETG